MVTLPQRGSQAFAPVGGVRFDNQVSQQRAQLIGGEMDDGLVIERNLKATQERKNQMRLAGTLPVAIISS